MATTTHVDTTSSGGKLVFHLFAALAEFERGVIRERTLAGLQALALEAKDLAEVARRPAVAPSTLYRHLPRARTAALET